MEQLATFNETLRQLANVERDIATQQAALVEQKSALDGRREQLAALRKERQLALAKLNRDVSDRDRKLKAREQEQAELGRVLKTIEETLARQAREAEEARKHELAERQRQEEALKRTPAPRRAPSKARWSPAPAPPTAARSPAPGASCPGQ